MIGIPTEVYPEELEGWQGVRHGNSTKTLAQSLYLSKFQKGRLKCVPLSAHK